MLALKRLLAIFTASVFVSCAVEPTAKQTSKARYDDDPNPHITPGDQSEDAESSKPRVRQTNRNTNTNTANSGNNDYSQSSNEDDEAEEQLNEEVVEEQEEVEQEEEVVEEPKVPEGPLVALQAPAAAQNYTLLSQNTITVPVTAVAAGTATFSIERSALDLVDLEQDIAIAPALPTLSFTSPNEVKMLTINVNINSKTPATGAQSFTLVATTGQDTTEVEIPFMVEAMVDITVNNLDDPVGQNADENLNWSSNGQNIEVRNGTMVKFTNLDPNNGLVVYMNGGQHGPTGSPFAAGESYIPGDGDLCGNSNRATFIFYDHNNESGDHAQTITCVDNQ